MSNYLRLLERNKKRSIVELKEDEYGGLGNSSCTPENRMQSSAVLSDRAIEPSTRANEEQEVEFFGVLDTLPQVTTKSSIMLERLGIRPEYLSTRVGLNGNRKQLSQEQAMLMSKKVVARVSTSVGFDGASEIPIEVLSQLLSCHVSKLGRTLKVLADSYRKQYSAMELLKIFLQVAGNGNLAALAEHMKDSRNFVQPSPQQSSNMHHQSMQPQLPLPQQNTLQLPQQIQWQMHPQMPQMVNPQNLTVQQQQQLERMRRRQASSPRPVMSMDKDRPMVEVKLENPPDFPMDSNTFSAINSRQNQMQLLHYRGSWDRLAIK